MAWWIWALIAYFGINLILTISAIIFAWRMGEPFYLDDILGAIQGILFALPMVVIAIFNAWIDR